MKRSSFHRLVLLLPLAASSVSAQPSSTPPTQGPATAQKPAALDFTATGPQAAPAYPAVSAEATERDAPASVQAASERSPADTPTPTEGAGSKPQSIGSQAVANVVVNTHAVDEPRPPAGEPERPRLLHGFRLGYMNWLNLHKRPKGDDPDAQSPADDLGLQSQHMFVIGYEIAQRLSAGSEDLNVLLVANLMAAGLEQSKLLPSANALIGFEFRRALQLGVGANLAPVGLDDKVAHMIVAAGWTPRSGELYLPVHLFFIPDVDGYHRIGLTFGVTWERSGF